MDSQNTSFSQPPSAIDPDEARRRFLASMGIGDPEPEAPAKSVQEEPELEENEDEVALSSSPDELELPGAPKSSPVRGRVISYEVKPKTAVIESQPEAEEAPKATELEEATGQPTPDHHIEDRNEKEVVNETPSAKVEASPAEEPQPMSESTADTKRPLQLSCPKCKGDLVLMPEHIGIEGACVWCETKIVAARSGSDGEVRVFPLFQPDSPKPAAEVISESSHEPKALEPVSEVPQEVTEMVSREKMDPSPEFAETAEAGFEAVPEKEAPATESASASEAAAPEWNSGFETPAPPVAEKSEEPTPSPAAGFGDLPSGFGDAAAPELAPETSEGSAEPVPPGFEDHSPSSAPELPSPADEAPKSKPGNGSQAAAPAGFADGFSVDPFASAMPATEEAKEESAAAEAPAGFSEGWGEAPAPESSPADEPAGFSESPFSDDAFVEFGTPGSPEPKVDEVDEAEAEAPAAGFSDASSWGPPAAPGSNDLSPAPAAPQEKDEAPKSFDEPAGFQSAFEAVLPKGDEPEAAVEGPLWGSADEAPAAWGSAPEPAAPVTDLSSEALPQAPADDAPPSAFGEAASEFGSGFAISASENGSFPAEMAPSQENTDSIFSDATDSDEAVSEEIASWGSGPGAEAPSATPFVEDEVKESDPVPAADSKPQLFATAPSNDTGGSIFGNQTAAKAGPPPIPGTPAPAEKSGNGLFGGSPTVISQPLGSKSAKKKGKGLIVFLVILLGLVCGAALASFVLPVDEYVEKARTFMEQKLNMDSEVDPALFLSEMVSPGAGPATPQLPPGLEAATPSAGTPASESAPTPEPAAPAEPDNAPVQAPVAP